MIILHAWRTVPGAALSPNGEKDTEYGVYFTGFIMHGVLKSGRTAGKNSSGVQDQVICTSRTEENFHA